MNTIRTVGALVSVIALANCRPSGPRAADSAQDRFVSIQESSGVDESAVVHNLQALRPHLRECVHGSGELVSARISVKQGAPIIDLDVSSFSAPERECISNVIRDAGIDQYMKGSDASVLFRIEW